MRIVAIFAKKQRYMSKVTFAMPVYNVADYIEKSLLSALNQTYSNIEYILVDDKGLDNSMEIACRVINEHSRGKDVRIIKHEVNEGTATARNTAINAATGEYLFFLDSDDYISLDCIELFINKMQENPVDFVDASCMKVNPDGTQYPEFEYTKDMHVVKNGEHAVADYCFGHQQPIFVSVTNKLYSMDFLRKYHIAFMPGYTIDDAWFTYQVILCARSCLLLSRFTLFYTTNSQSNSSDYKKGNGYSEKVANQYVNIQYAKCDYIQSVRNQPFYKGLLVNIMFMSVYHAYRIWSSSKLTKELQTKLVEKLLSLNLEFSQKGQSNNGTFKYWFLFIFYNLPLSIKFFLIKISVYSNLKLLFRYVFHF